MVDDGAMTSGHEMTAVREIPAGHEAFWREYLAGHTVTRVPRWTRRAEPGVAEVILPVPPAAAAWVREREMELRTLVIAALVRVVSLFALEPDVTVGYQVDGPMVPLRLELDDGTWLDLIDAVSRAEHALASHRADLPRADHPLFDIGYSTPAPEGRPALALCVEHDGEQLRLQADRSSFDDEFAERFGGYLTRALEAIAAAPEQRFLDADLMSPAERHQLVYERHGSTRELPDARFAGLFAAQVRKLPDAVAAIHNGQSWTYRQVDDAANQIAHALLEAGLGAEDVVAIATGRHLRWLAAIVGVLRAGGAYLPVEPDLPPARIRALLTRSGCRFALTESDGLPGMDPDGRPGAKPGGHLWSRPVTDVLDAGYPTTDPAVVVGATQLAYIYFTSGSTGEPKGAMCEHLGMVNHLLAKIEDFGIGAHDVVVQNAAQSFDISLWQLLAPLIAGGTTAILSREDILDVRRFLDAAVVVGTTVLQVVPSYLDILLRHVEQHARDLGRLRYLCVTGEAISKPLVDRWFASYPQIKLVNAYGATEASDDTTHEIMSRPPDEPLVPVGRPVNNVTVYVLGPGDTVQPLGAPGEIAFSGICVGRGYINDPDRTVQSFVDDPLVPGERMYRTGDFGRWLPSGSLEFHGRRDEQVKVNGIRIELGEVESKVLEHPQVTAACVVASPLPGAGKSLVAFYTSGGALHPEDLRAHLSGVLAASAVPAKLVQVDALPLTSNGKVDKRRLVAQAQEQFSAVTGTGAGPETPMQRRIAQAWARVLNRPITDIGRDDHFFDTGGGSLSALRLVASLDGLISLDDLLRNPVLSALAAAVEAPAAGGHGLLHLLAGPPVDPSYALICFPYAAGTAVNFQPLAAAVTSRDPTIAVYALQPPGHDLGRPDEPLFEFDALARLAAEEAGAIGAPLALWGHCTGVALALEVARRLSAVRQVFLGARLMAPPADLIRENAELSGADTELIARLAADGGLDGLEPHELSGTDRAMIGRVYRHDVQSANRFLVEMAQSWRGDRLGCPVRVVVSTSDATTAGYQERYRQWAAVAEHVELAEVAGGGHYFARTQAAATAGIVLDALRVHEGKAA